MSLNLSLPSEETELGPRICVVGVGGAGGNAVNNMIRSNLVGCEFLVCNTDAQAMKQSLAERRIQLGVGVTRGLGAGSRPEVGRIAAEEALDEIMKALDGCNMVFITAGMGGGTGTGAAPVIARAAREAGILTIGVVTKPFQFEGTHRMRLADSGIHEMQKYVDTLIIIPNQNLFRVANERTTFADAFKMADDVLHSGVAGVTDLMVKPGLINLDFADIRAVMSEMGKAMMGTGEAEGDRRAIDAAEAAISNPLLEDVSMKGARGVLINITGGMDMTLFEVDEAANRVREEVDPDANIIFGSTFDDKLAGKMRISVVATGIDAEPVAQPRPTFTLVSDRSNEAAAKPAAERVAPVAIEAEPPLPRIAAIEAAATGTDAFIAPRAVEAVARPTPVAQPAVVAEPRVAAAAAAKPKRGPSLFERMTGAARHRHAEEPPAPAPAPRAAAPTQPRLGPLDAADRLAPAKEEDMLDIPAFLRRQAN
jgi:cell division protein FtsZ